MSLPKLFETTRRPLVPSGALSAPGGGPPGVSSGTTLSFVMQHQEQDNWCWAAVTVSAFDFYRHGSGSLQCDVVNAELGRGDCCVNGGSSDCNRVGPLDGPLNRNHNLKQLKAGATQFQPLNAEIENGRPLGCRIAWDGGGAHFVIIHGYASQGVGAAATNTIEVADPWYGSSSQNFSLFPRAYQGGGTWTHSYFTKQAP
jgi:hypothetical protein